MHSTHTRRKISLVNPTISNAVLHDDAFRLLACFVFRGLWSISPLGCKNLTRRHIDEAPQYLRVSKGRQLGVCCCKVRQEQLLVFGVCLNILSALRIIGQNPV